MLNRFLLGLTSFFLTLLFVGQVLSESRLAQDDERSIFALTRLHQIIMTMTRGEWDVLQTSDARIGNSVASAEAGTDYRRSDGRIVHVGSGFRGFFPWVHADMVVNGVEIRDIGLRYKGNFSFLSSSAAAPFRANLKVKTDLFDGKSSWDGVETLNFHAGVLDPSLMREALGYALFRAAGVPSSRTAYAEITFNIPGLHTNARGGVYLLIENINKQFLKRALPPGTGLLFKPEGTRGGITSRGESWSQYLPTYRPDREATLQEQKRTMEFANLISQPDVALFRSRIGTYLDVDQFLRYVAVNSFLLNWDSYLTGNHNYYFYLDPKDDKFRFIPWDLDLSAGYSGFGGPADIGEMMRPFRGDNRLIYWLLDDPAIAENYRGIIKELSKTVFARAELEKILVDLEKVSPNRDPTLRTFLDGRVAYLNGLVAGWEK
jgi:spore coat protein H